MANWQERIRQRETEIARQQLIATSHDADKVKRQEEELVNAFEAIDRLGVEELLRDIKRDVWGNKGEIIRLDDFYLNNDCNSFPIQRKGLSLVYAYEEPDDGEHEVETVGHRNNFKLFKDYYHEGPRSQQIIGMGDITHERRFEPHIEKTPVIKDHGLVFHMEHKNTYLSVYVAYDEHSLDKFGLFVSDSLLGGRSLVAETRNFQRNARFPGDVFRSLSIFSDLKTVRDALTDACIGRVRLQGLPDNIDLYVQQKLAQISPSQLRR